MSRLDFSKPEVLQIMSDRFLLIHQDTGRNEVWSAEIGDLTRGQVKLIVAHLITKGHKCYHVVNSMDSGIIFGKV